MSLYITVPIIASNTLLDRGIAIVIVLFILSLISERFITFCKLYFVKGKELWGLIDADNDLRTKRNTKDEEKNREVQILGVNIKLSILIALLAKANLFAIISADPPYDSLGWHININAFSINNIGHYIKVIFGCVLGGLFISLGSKFWHDMLDMLFEAKNYKQKLNDSTTYQVENTLQLDVWLKATQSDMVRKVFDENREMLKNLKNVIAVGIAHDENTEKYIEVVINDNDTHLIPKTLPFTLPSGVMKDILIKVRISSGIETHLNLSDDITNKGFPHLFGSSGLSVCYKNDMDKKAMLLTCYHVVIGKKNNYDHFLFEGTEDIISPHGNQGTKIGSINYAVKNSEIDAALVDLDNVTIDNITPDGEIKQAREIKYEEQYGKVKVKMFGFNRNRDKQEGVIQSINNYVSITYKIPNGTKKNMDLYNLIAVTSVDSEPFSLPGDSGSALLDENNQVIGIVVAGDKTTSYIIPIQTIFNQLNIQLT